MKCACKNGECKRPADYFPALRMVGAKTGEMVLGLPTCHECSKQVTVASLIFPDKMSKVQKGLRKMGQVVTNISELDLLWFDIDASEVQPVRRALEE